MKRRPDDDSGILALDIATELGWCYGRPSDTTPTWGTVRFAGALPNVLIALDAWLRGMIEQRRPRRVVIEQAPSLRWGGGKTNATTLIRLTGMCGKVEEVCARYGQALDCSETPSQRWKTALCGPMGRAKFGKEVKPYPPFQALALRGWELTNHNAADAVGIWLYAVGVFAPELALQFDPLVRRAASRGKR